ncbi:MAG: hypothetical protein N2038_13860 [Geminicoccaceae bacterium]|nr:hypothetical protein [Geminicoccaceae bacterium]MCS7266491.1 hypothetical protein [Geminicoccaceae bacterium]MCX7631320.1 hypothetical protein [Geminicoccaceae bacterium]MDW8123913.1 hypothetical protein [Geminicoccaceae bacterium]MDW8340024.1 hypothetical protein [Geminicoccaceae bacterium]
MERDGSDPIERAAEISVLRGVGFGSLAIGCACLGLAPYPVVALYLAAASALLMAAILALKGRLAPRRPYTRTEAWLLLDPRPRLAPAVAQRLVGRALARTFHRYARLALRASIGLWLAGLIARLFGLG